MMHEAAPAMDNHLHSRRSLLLRKFLHAYRLTWKVMRWRKPMHGAVIV